MLIQLHSEVASFRVSCGSDSPYDNLPTLHPGSVHCAGFSFLAAGDLASHISLPLVGDGSLETNATW